jgi:hypothetical protein
VEDAVVSSQQMTPFSLFSHDWMTRVYRKLRVSGHVRFALVKRCALVIMLTWVPLAMLAVYGGLVDTSPTVRNFFADFAAYAQFLVAMPLFVIFEPIMDFHTRAAAEQFISCGVIRPDERSRLRDVHALIARLRTSCWPDLVCIVIAYGLSLVILVPEFRPGALATWHVQDYAHWRTFTAAGAWEFLIALPILNYTWLRFAWKIMLWIYYLFRTTRMRLDLHPTHPDLTGGIGFISEAQGQFALFILAYGISNIAATIGYEIVVLHYSFRTMTVWGPMVGFTIGAPLLFTLPLFMFTRQLYFAKQHALALYRQRVTARSRRFEKFWRQGEKSGQFASDEIRELTEFNSLSTMFTHIEQMRVVPFDLRSFGQLLGSSFGSIATVLPLLHYDGQLTKAFDAIGRLFGHLGG